MADLKSQPTIDDAEARRLAALRDYRILDTEAEPPFDDLALLASHICQTPVALVSLVDADRQWFKARVGTALTGSPREMSFCAHAIKSHELFTINDTTKDPRFANNPLVTGDPHVRFYAGAPLVTQSGETLGTLCVVDCVPRDLQPEQAGALKALARQVVSQLELRRAAAMNAAMCSKAKRQARRRAREAMRDALTDLPNRPCLAQHLSETLEQLRGGTATGRSAVMMVDLDRFKLVNDTLGHAVGDAVLKHVGKILRNSVRTRRDQKQPTRGKDVVARLGGDEFTILLNHLSTPHAAEVVAQRIIEAMAEPFTFDGHSLQIGASVGLVHVESRHKDADHVLREADIALYAAKEAGKARYCVFNAQMHADMLHNVRLERDLRDVLLASHDDVRSQLELHYQPIVEVGSGMPVAFEALVRWRHPELGLIPPGAFIPMAEDTGQITKLGAWVMAEACAQLERWTRQDRAFANLSINVNVARRQLVDPDLVPHIRGLLEKHDLHPSRVRLEITESTVMHNTDAASEAFDRLRSLGVPLYMDDFGTGHSSLGCLKRFPLDGLKIDRSFVSMMAESAESDAIVRAVMELARCFGMKVTAEGVETSEQWWLLRQFGCHFAQGYYFAKPLTADAAANYVLTANDRTHDLLIAA